MKYIPHDYQSYATQFILDHPIAAVLLQMGLGKSVITLTAIKALLDRGEISRVLVVAPLRVARDTWPQEIRKWDHLAGLTYSVAVGTAEQRIAALQESVNIHIINRENITWLVEESRLPFQYDMLVIDELSSFKNSQAKRFKSLIRVRPDVNRVVGLTGTPAGNGLMDLFGEFRLLDLGKRLGRFLTGYRNAYFMPDRIINGKTVSWKEKPGADKAIYQRISDITVSMKSVDYLKMPEILYNRVSVYMSPEEYRTYMELASAMVVRIRERMKESLQDGGQKEFGDDCKASDEFVIDAKNAAVLSGKLAQLANGAIYAENGEAVRFHDRKLDALEDLIEAANGRPLLIAYWYQHDIDRILQRFPDVRCLRKARDMQDWNDGKIPVAAIHPASAGHGLNLQKGGNAIVWFGLTWSLELYQQTNARLWRQGQQAETVVVHHIITENTIDGYILDLLASKDRTQEDLIRAVKASIPSKVRKGA